jgi:hypothetical protein
VQVPQLITLPQPGPPHPSVASPQSNPWLAHVSGSHGGVPHTLAGPPPPHCWHGGQLPQSRGPPQPSVAVPQSRPCSAQVSAVQPVPVELVVLVVLVALVEAPPVEDDAPEAEELVALVVGAPPWPPAPVEEDADALAPPAEPLVESLPWPTTTVFEHAATPSAAREKKRRLLKDIKLRGR